MEGEILEDPILDFLSDIDRPEIERITASINEGTTLTNIYGEMGTMSADLLNSVESDLENRTTRSFHASEIYDSEYLIHQIAREIYDTLSRREKLLFRLQSGSISTPFGGAGVGTNNPFDRPIDILNKVSCRASSTVVIFIYDIQSLSTPNAEIEATLSEISNNLSENIQVVTCGEVQFDDIKYIEVQPLSKEEFINVFQEIFEGYSAEEVERIYNTTEGLPLYLGILIEANRSNESIDLDQVGDQAASLIEDYVISLKPEEQEFLRRVSVATELDEDVCTKLTDHSPVEAASMLRQLSNKLAIREVGRRDGLTRYKIRKDIHSYLYQRSIDSQDSHRRMLKHYLSEFFDKDEDGLIGKAFYPGILCSYHLKGCVGDNPTSEKIKSELERFEFSLEEEVELCLTFLPMFCFQEGESNDVLFDLLDNLRKRYEDQYPDDADLGEIIGIDGYRIGYRILLANQKTERSETQELFTEAAEICEESLQYIANVAGEQDNLGYWVEALYLTAAYSYKKADEYSDQSTQYKNQVDRFLDPIYQKLEILGLSQTLINDLYYRSASLYVQLDLDKVFSELLSSELDGAFGVISSQQSTKQYLFEAQGSMKSAVNSAGGALYKELQNHPRELTHFIDDVSQLLAPDEMVHNKEEMSKDSWELGFIIRSQAAKLIYLIARNLGLYKHCYSRQRSIHIQSQ